MIKYAPRYYFIEFFISILITAQLKVHYIAGYGRRISVTCDIPSQFHLKVCSYKIKEAKAYQWP